jgi:hypothetical protein
VLIQIPFYTPISQILKHLLFIGGIQFIGSVKKLAARVKRQSLEKHLKQEVNLLERIKTDLDQAIH